MKIKNNSISLLITSIFLQSFSFLSIKFSTTKEGFGIYVFLIMALFFMAFRAIVWQYLLRLTDLSLIYPFAALVQILILIYAVLFFNEEISIYNVIGLSIMLAGIFYLTTGK